MIRATSLGHAALFVETENARVLMDPILRNAISGGGNIIDPPRELDLATLTGLDLVIISHHHSDHYNLDDLALIPDGVNQRFVIPDDASMETALRKWGVAHVTRLSSGDSLSVGDLKITATPSDVPFPEMGILFEQKNGNCLLNLVDSVFHPKLAELSQIVGSPPDVILAPFQAGGYMSFLTLREGNLPPGLVPAIEGWSQEYLEELATDLQGFRPKMVIAFADGLAYKDQGINARHFPMADSVFVNRLAEMRIPAHPARPGLVIEVSDQPTVSQADESFVRVHTELAADRRFNPDLPLAVRPLSWFELPLGGEGKQPSPDWLTLLRERMSERLMPLLTKPSAETIRKTLCAWHLELLGAETRTVLCCDWPDVSGEPVVRVHGAPPPDRPYGIVCHGADLAEVAKGHLNLEIITLGGLFRYRSPEDDADLEKLRGRVLRPLNWFFGE